MSVCQRMAFSPFSISRISTLARNPFPRLSLTHCFETHPHLYCTHDFDIAAEGDEFIAPGGGIKEGILRREGEKYWLAPPTPSTRVPALARANLSLLGGPRGSVSVWGWRMLGFFKAEEARPI